MAQLSRITLMLISFSVKYKLPSLNLLHDSIKTETSKLINTKLWALKQLTDRSPLYSFTVFKTLSHSFEIY